MKIRWLILFIILSLLSAYEETLQLIQRGDWAREVTWLPIWETAWDGTWKLFDTHHLVFGLFALVMMILLTSERKNIFTLKNKILTETAHILIYWWIFFWIRNLGMHVIFMKYEFIRWEYLLPVTF